MLGSKTRTATGANHVMKTIRSEPASRSCWNRVWLIITGKQSWKLTEATVFSCEWTDLPNQIDNLIGHYHLTYSYKVDGNFYSGHFEDYGMQDEEYFKRNDVFQVRYNPRRPEKSYYSGSRIRNIVALIWLLLAAAVILFFTIPYLASHIHH
jgi:Protein of unknown function (DUF3592)